MGRPPRRTTAAAGASGSPPGRGAGDAASTDDADSRSAHPACQAFADLKVGRGRDGSAKRRAAPGDTTSVSDGGLTAQKDIPLFGTAAGKGTRNRPQSCRP